MTKEKTKFEKWLAGYTVARLAKELEVSRPAVYFWLRGGSIPRPDKATQIVGLSGGALTLEDIYAHQKEVVK